MDPGSRIRKIKTLYKMRENPHISRRLGLKDISSKKDEKVNYLQLWATKKPSNTAYLHDI